MLRGVLVCGEVGLIHGSNQGGQWEGQQTTTQTLTDPSYNLAYKPLAWRVR